MNNNVFKYVFKYIMIGNPSVGKSCLLNQFLNNQFSEEYEVTVGVEFGAKTVETPDKSRVKLQVWDTAGQENFKSVIRAYYRSTAVAVVVFDITVRSSFEAVQDWIAECRANGNPEAVLVLVGNKTDLAGKRVVTREEGESFAKKNGMLYFETSAKSNEGVEEMFTRSAEAVLGKIAAGVIDPKVESYGVKLGVQAPPSSLKRAALTQPKEGGGCCKK